MNEITKPNWRVRIAIYDMNEQTPEEPEMWTDEPLYSGKAAADEMQVQASRTYRYFENKLAREQ
jgi:hypothetical protein